MSAADYDPAAAQLARDAAVAQVDEHAEAAWRAAADSVIRHCAKTCDTFTTDRVYWFLDRMDVATHERRALGPRMTAAESAGLIEPTGHFHLSVRASRHRAPLRVWRSLIR